MMFENKRKINEEYSDIIDKNGFQEWFEENFNDDCGYTLFSNIVEYVEAQGLDKEETIYLLYNLLGGIGIEPEEIEQFVS